MSAAHILVVDDEADIRGLLKEILSEEGYDVDVAGDAGQARASRAPFIPSKRLNRTSSFSTWALVSRSFTL
jgi:hypothetical protein